MSVPLTGRWKPAAPVLFLVCGWLACATAGELGANWSSRVWQVDDGLPAANVAGIAQTRDGYLWLAENGGGVIRFSAGTGTARMFAATNGLPDALALQMIETPDHAVWICYD